nr:MAG TPA_asm: hypothetical protein [Caudoviricetes sp.]
MLSYLFNLNLIIMVQIIFGIVALAGIVSNMSYFNK